MAEFHRNLQQEIKNLSGRKEMSRNEENHKKSHHESYCFNGHFPSSNHLLWKPTAFISSVMLSDLLHQSFSMDFADSQCGRLDVRLLLQFLNKVVMKNGNCVRIMARRCQKLVILCCFLSVMCFKKKSPPKKRFMWPDSNRREKIFKGRLGSNSVKNCRNI